MAISTYLSAPIKIPGCKCYVVRGKLYIYHRATRTRIRIAPGTPEFDAEIAAAKKSVKPLPTDKRPLNLISASFLRTDEFKRLPSQTRARLRAAAKLVRAIGQSHYVADATTPSPEPPE